MNWTEIIVAIISALAGSGGILAYIKLRMDKAEKRVAEEQKEKAEYEAAHLAWHDAANSLFFWMKRHLREGQPLNGEYEKAIIDAETAKSKMHDLEKKLMAKNITN